MKWLTYLILLACFAVLDAGNSLNYIAFGPANIRPDMMLIFTLFFAVNCDKETAILTSFFAGAVADAASMTMGPHMIMFGLAGYLGTMLQRDMIMKTFTRQAFTILFLGAIVHSGVIGLTSFKPDIEVQFSWIEAGGSVLYSAVAGPAVWAALTWISPLMGIERLRQRI